MSPTRLGEEETPLIKAYFEYRRINRDNYNSHCFINRYGKCVFCPDVDLGHPDIYDVSYSICPALK